MDRWPLGQLFVVRGHGDISTYALVFEQKMNIDRQDVQDVVKSLIDSIVSCESLVFEFRIAKMDQ